LTRDSFAGAACAGPKAQIRPPATRRENPRSTTIQRERGKTTVIVAVKNGGLRLQTGVRLSFRRFCS
jgi:hypothetical protein